MTPKEILQGRLNYLRDEGDRLKAEQNRIEQRVRNILATGTAYREEALALEAAITKLDN